MLGFFAVYVAIYVYGIRQLPDCSGARCPPTYSQLTFPTMFIGLAILNLGQYWWVRQVERRCGIWFRAAGGALGDFNCYIRRPGITAEAAAAALARYSRAVERPVARGALVVALFSVPYFLVLIALALLTAWLPTQWMPA